MVILNSSFVLHHCLDFCEPFVADATLAAVRRPSIAVIGGGITGLAAAHRVHELLPNAEITLFEASPRPGGVLETVERDGFLIERSADNFLTRLPQAVELCRRLGIENELVSTIESRRRAFVVRNGRLVPIPDGFVLMEPRRLAPLLRSPILSVAGKLRLLAEPLVPRGRASTLNAGGDSPNRADESVASFARRRLGGEVFERLVQPLVAGIYTADPEMLSMAAAMPEFLAHERNHGSLLMAARALKSDQAVMQPGNSSDRPEHEASGARYSLFVAPRGGMNVIVNAVAAKLPASTIKLRTVIESVWPTGDGRWQLNPQSASSSPDAAGNLQSRFDAVIVAVPTYVAARLVQGFDPSLSTELSAIEYAGCAIVSLGYRRDQIGHALDGFGFVVPQVEGRRIVAGSFASQKFPGRAPDGAVLVRVFIGGALQPELLDLPDAELRRMAIDELQELIRSTGQPLFADIARWPRSMPQYHVGHLGRVARIEKLAGRYATLALAGNAYHGVGIPQCIASGEMAAERVVAAHKKTAVTVGRL
jgi:oxygen-dependent protoporphyrinogen oxidase